MDRHPVGVMLLCFLMVLAGGCKRDEYHEIGSRQPAGRHVTIHPVNASFTLQTITMDESSQRRRASMLLVNQSGHPLTLAVEALPEGDATVPVNHASIQVEQQTKEGWTQVRYGGRTCRSSRTHELEPGGRIVLDVWLPEPITQGSIVRLTYAGAVSEPFAIE